MPPARGARRVNNENDENGPTTRVTRAKSAALTGPTDGVVKKALHAKKASISVQAGTGNDTGTQRKRVALGDVSNVNKGETKDTASKEAKKPLQSTAGLVAKAAQPTGIQKSSKANATRSILGARDKNGAANDLKRPASATGLAGNAQKKRTTSSMPSHQSIREASPSSENIEAGRSESKRVESRLDEGGVKVEITETVKVTTRKPNGEEVQKEIIREEKHIRPSLASLQDDQFQEQIDAMDAEDEPDPLMVSEYVYDILDYMKDLEVNTMPNPDYMEHQSELEWRMRGVLMDWLLEVHMRFHLLPETLYLTVNIIDRFLSCKVVQLERLQLVGVTALFIASKYEEVLSPHIGNFRNVADDTFTEGEILSAERYILANLDYDLSFPNPMHFMRRISKADGYDIQTRTLAKYLLEISIMDHRFLEFRPSVNAAASMHLARLILEKGDWDPILVHYSGYTEEDIQPAVQTMIDYLQEPVVHNAFYRKYAAKKFLKASLHARAWAKKFGAEFSGADREEQSP